MANFSITNSTVSGGGGTQQAVASTPKTLIGTYGSTTAPVRGKVYDLLIGTNGTPADNTTEWDIPRATTSVGGTVATPQALDPADAASTSVITVNSTTEGTITANSDVFYVGVNQRASYRWVASPGSELIWPATASNGLVLRVKSASGYTGTATGNWLFQEQ